MADPYATEAPDLSAKPTGDAPWLQVVAEAGGALIGADGVVPAGELLVIHTRGVGTLAPFARVDAASAVLLWIEHVARDASAPTANALLRALVDGTAPIYAIKHGYVAGPEDREGATPVEPGLIARLLSARERIGWEQDPDFGYEVPAAVPGIEDPEARALMPRLLYADHDRVYEHASLVEEKKRERGEIVAAVPGLAPEIAAATGWPPKPTSDRWKD